MSREGERLVANFVETLDRNTAASEGFLPPALLPLSDDCLPPFLVPSGEPFDFEPFDLLEVLDPLGDDIIDPYPLEASP